MSKVFFAFGMALLALASCQNEAIDSPRIEEKIINVDELTGVQHDIMVNILSSKYGGYHKGQPATRALGSFSLTPYVDDGDTLLYIAQYSDGWEIYSANQATKMILFSSDHGKFDLNDPNMPSALKDLIHANADAIRELAKNPNHRIDKSWGAAALTEEDLANSKVIVKGKGQTRSSSYPEIPPGEWVLLDQEDLSSETYTSPKLTVTEWDQDYPWNKYSKTVTDKSNNPIQTPAGCVPVAIAQYLYYTHGLNGVPATTISGATPINNGTDYSFYGSSSTIWDQMATTYGYYTSGLNETAMFIGYVGRELKAKYGADGTFVYDSDAIRYLNKVYNTTFKIVDFNYTYVKSSIDKKYPVLASARTNQESTRASQSKGGHVFLVERYREKINKTKYIYGLVRDPWTSDTEDDPYAENEVDENGNIISYAYTKEVIIAHTLNNEISMNWGYSAWYNNIFYSTWTTEWNAGGHNFNLEHKTFTRADIK